MLVWAAVGGRTSEYKQAGPGDCILDRYLVLNEIARGGMGVIYDVRDLASDRSQSTVVTAKLGLAERLTDGEYWHGLVREARTTQSLGKTARKHGGGVPMVIDQGDDPIFGPAFVMEKLSRGLMLDHLLRVGGRLALSKSLVFARDIANVIHFAHGQSFIHRDLTPENVYVHDEPSPEYHVVVLDWGIATSLSVTRTSDPVGIGKGVYMAPERARGDQGDERTDVYSLGIMLIEMLTGTRPRLVHGEVDLSSLDGLTSSSDLDAELSALVRRSTAPSVDARMGSMQEFATALDRIRSDFEEAKHSSNIVTIPGIILPPTHKSTDREVEDDDAVAQPAWPETTRGYGGESPAVQEKPPSSAHLLRTLLAVLGVALGLVVFLWRADRADALRERQDQAAKLAEMKTILEGFATERQRQAAELDQAKRAVEDVSTMAARAFTTFEATVNSLNTRHNKDRAAIARLKAQLKDLQSRLQAATATISELATQKQIFAERIRQLEDKLREMQNSVAPRSEKVRSEIDELDAKISAWEAQSGPEKENARRRLCSALETLSSDSDAEGFRDRLLGMRRRAECAD